MLKKAALQEKQPGICTNPIPKTAGKKSFEIFYQGCPEGLLSDFYMQRFREQNFGKEYFRKKRITELRKEFP